MSFASGLCRMPYCLNQTRSHAKICDECLKQASPPSSTLPVVSMADLQTTLDKVKGDAREEAAKFCEAKAAYLEEKAAGKTINDSELEWAYVHIAMWLKSTAAQIRSGLTFDQWMGKKHEKEGEA